MHLRDVGILLLTRTLRSSLYTFPEIKIHIDSGKFVSLHIKLIRRHGSDLELEQSFKLQREINIAI